MKTLITRVTLAVAFVAAALSPAIAQTALPFASTTTAMTVDSRTVTLSSVTGLAAPTTSAVTYIFADGELMQVLALNTTTKAATVIRGVGQTRAVSHAANTFVYNTTSDAVVTYDPSGNCTPSANTSLPLLNVRNGNIWHCQTTTSGSQWMATNLTPIAETRPRAVVGVLSAAGLVSPNTAIGLNYTILPTDYTVILSTNGTTPGSVVTAIKSFTLPSHVGLAGKQIIIKDESGGLSATTKIVLVGTIDGTNSGTATVVQLVTPWGAVGLEAGSGGWFTIWCHGGNGSTTCR